MAEKFLSESDLKNLLKCSRCGQVPEGGPIFMCRTGHQECSQCSIKMAASSPRSFSDPEGPDIHTCAICQARVTKTRNLFAECVLIQLECSRADESALAAACGPDPGLLYRAVGSVAALVDQGFGSLSNGFHMFDEPQFPIPPLALLPSLHSDAPRSLFYTDFSPRARPKSRRDPERLTVVTSSYAEEHTMSKRPIRCPMHPCGRNVAVATLAHHFCFDHSDVPPLSLELDVASRLFIDPSKVPFDLGRCLAMLLVPNKGVALQSCSNTSLMPASAPRLRQASVIPLLLMASRMHCSTVSGAAVDEAKRSRGDFYADTSPQQDSVSLLVLWVAGIETSCSHFTTIQMLDEMTNLRSMQYTGPVMSLRTNQSVVEVFRQGDCLAIHSSILNSIKGEAGGCDVHITVH